MDRAENCWDAHMQIIAEFSDPGEMFAKFSEQDRFAQAVGHAQDNRMTFGNLHAAIG